ncbi:MAG: hypothetical protein ACE15D_05885 [Candidatus Eisenbacteria bacterium]
MQTEPNVTSWHTPPELTGQAIAVAYGQDDEGGCWERTADRSGPETSYRYLGHVSEIRGAWEPWQRQPDAAQIDARIEWDGRGSLAMIRPLTDDAHDWLRENLADSAVWVQGAVVLEPRFLQAIVSDMNDAGLQVRN